MRSTLNRNHRRRIRIGEREAAAKPRFVELRIELAEPQSLEVKGEVCRQRELRQGVLIARRGHIDADSCQEFAQHQWL